jgi:hypothetical protein
MVTFTSTLKLKAMKKLFCTVVTDFDGTMESPEIFHTKTETPAKATERIKAEYLERGFSEETFEEQFEAFTFEVTDLDIIEA